MYQIYRLISASGAKVSDLTTLVPRTRRAGEFTWIDFQGYHVAPPGMDLVQALGLGVVGATKAVIEDLCRQYHAALAAHGPAGLVETYTFEMLWEDFMGGCLLWYSCYVFVMCQTVPNP